MCGMVGEECCTRMGMGLWALEVGDKAWKLEVWGSWGSLGKMGGDGGLEQGFSTGVQWHCVEHL